MRYNRKVSALIEAKKVVENYCTSNMGIKESEAREIMINKVHFCFMPMWIETDYYQWSQRKIGADK